MQVLLSHISRAQQQPHHVRRRIAFVLASVGAGFVALLWGTISVSTNAFALSNRHAPNTEPVVQNAQLASVAAARAEKDEPRIEIVDAVVPGAKTESEKTFIPF